MTFQRFIQMLATGAMALLLAGPVGAVEPDEILKDSALETRAREISAGLRCLVCQNQSIDDSDAPLAKDLRVLVREKLTAGATDEEAVAFIVERYGDYVLLKPRFNWHNLLLWLSMPLLLAFGGYLVWRSLPRSTAGGPAAPLSTAERAKLDAMLQRGEPDHGQS